MPGSIGWPTEHGELERLQTWLAEASPAPWDGDADPLVGGVWLCAPTRSAGDRPGEPAWAAAVTMHGGVVLAETLVRGHTGDAYRCGLLALREGPMLEAAVRALSTQPVVVLVHATGRDHPRGAGLAPHLGAVLDLPTIGVTDRALVAVARARPGPARGDRVPLVLGDVQVAALVRTRVGARPVVVHPGWRVGIEPAISLVVASSDRARTPEPLRRARRLARLGRAVDEGRLG